MELQIPQSFKVQWLNTTLKFIKDDTQLVKNYPQMPSSHVEYLHNLIWQRKKDVGLGFKSLYSPVWEAMKIYSIKYKFKIVVEKSEDGKSGHLIMEKIPKTGEPAKKLHGEMKDKNNNDEKKERDNETIQNYEVPKMSQQEAVKCKQQEPQRLKKAKTKKPIPKMSKGLKMFLENQEILDSLSPLFIKTTLKSILGFITDELSASKIFPNLAPIEARFLVNFLAIYERKKDLEVLLSPASNEILTEITNCFADFSKTCRLDISAVEINSNTNKREVKYTKVPVFPSKKKSKLKENSLLTKSTAVSSKNTTKFVKVHISEEDNITLEKNVSEETKKSKSINNTNILQNNTISKDRYANSEPIDKVIETIDNNVIEALSTFVKKADDVKPKTSTYLKDTNLNKSVLLPKKNISFTKEGTSSTTHTPSIRVDQKSPRMKILRDMTVPISSDKAVKMMQLMGWDGGALGLHGCGITEPIIPIPNFNARGLGHVSVKKPDKESNKETKKHIRSEIVNKIIKMIDNNIQTSFIKLQNQMDKREIQFWKITLQTINNRKNLDADIERRLEIKNKMIRNMDIIISMDFEDINRKIVITKKSKTDMEAENQNKKRKTKSKEIDTNTTRNTCSEVPFKRLALKSILELINSENYEKVIQFSEELTVKNINYLNIMIQLINERQHFQQKNCPVVAELGSKVLETIGDIFLSFEIYEKERYIVIRKRHPKSSINQEITKTIVNKVERDGNDKSVFDNVRGHLKKKEKVKLLNALYKYEIEVAERFEERQWYNTLDRSLLDNEQINKLMNDTLKERNKNNKNLTKTIKNDFYNNRVISANVKV